MSSSKTYDCNPYFINCNSTVLVGCICLGGCEKAFKEGDEVVLLEECDTTSMYTTVHAYHPQCFKISQWSDRCHGV